MSVVIVDGYNIIHAWPELRRVLREAGGEEARRALVSRLADYAAVQRLDVTVVFDGPRRRSGSAELVDGVSVVFSGAAGSADHLIERLAYESARAGAASQVVVATSDRLQRGLVRAMGVDTIDADGLRADVVAAALDTAERAGRSRERARFGGRLEQRISAETLRRLEAIRRGQHPDSA